MIKVRCECKAEHQDKLYGTNIRIVNKCKEAGKYRCTVCGKIHNK